MASSNILYIPSCARYGPAQRPCVLKKNPKRSPIGRSTTLVRMQARELNAVELEFGSTTFLNTMGPLCRLATRILLGFAFIDFASRGEAAAAFEAWGGGGGSSLKFPQGVAYCIPGAE